jgi:presenilin-like A22 family membrane protease
MLSMLWEVHLGYGKAFPYGSAFQLWEVLSVMIMFMRREYISGYSYTFHMLKIASSYQCYDRCISVMGGAILFV